MMGRKELTGRGIPTKPWKIWTQTEMFSLEDSDRLSFLREAVAHGGAS